jgi:hypothetical protein
MKLQIITAGILCIGLAAARAESEAIEINADTPWVVAANQPEAIQRALEDVKRDWYKVLGHTPVVLTQPPENWSGPLIYFGMGGKWLDELLADSSPESRSSEREFFHSSSARKSQSGLTSAATVSRNGLFHGPESFLLRVTRDDANRPIIIAAGSDLRGAIYAAYALSEEILGVDPWYFWTDNEPARRQSISIRGDFDKRFGPPTFKYRGWFMNDEDLLSGYSSDPLRENVFSMAIADRIFETLLRLRGNMAVPATWIFPDERLNELASRRGLILSFHHVQVVGLSTFRWPADVPFSFQRHPEIMEDYWRACIDFLKHKEVVWTVGYRGRSDKPFWDYEEGLDTPAARGKAISQAIARQVELIREVQPDAPIISNLWREGADLQNEGHIEMPPGVTTVWADCGQGLMTDDGKVEKGQGIYYHTAMWNTTSNPGSEMVNPERIFREIGRFIRAGATEYFLVNVSDVRPVPLSTDCVMKLVWNAKPYLGRGDKESMDAFILDWCRRQYGAEAADQTARLYTDYFNIPYHRQRPRPFGDRWPHTRLAGLHERALPLIEKRQPLSTWIFDRLAMTQETIDLNHSYLEDLAVRVEALTPSIPVNRRDFYQSHLVAQTRIHLLSLDMLQAYGMALRAYAEGDTPKVIDCAEASQRAVEKILEVLHEGEYGKWDGWFQGELFVGFYANRDRLRVLLATLRSEEIPPTRRILTPRSMFWYQRQAEFRANFPLFYPPAKAANPEVRQ